MRNLPKIGYQHVQRIPSEDPLVKAMTQVAKEEADSRPSRPRMVFPTRLVTATDWRKQND